MERLIKIKDVVPNLQGQVSNFIASFVENNERVDFPTFNHWEEDTAPEGNVCYYKDSRELKSMYVEGGNVMVCYNDGNNDEHTDYFTSLPLEEQLALIVRLCEIFC